MTDVTYPRIKYQGVPRTPLQGHLENPGYIYAKVADADAERALGEGWHDTAAEAIASAPKEGKVTAEQYALMAAQAAERGAVPPPRPKDEEFAPSKPRHSGGPSDPAAGIPETQEKQRREDEWPTERRKR